MADDIPLNAATNKDKKYRLQITLTDEQRERLTSLQSETESSTNADVIRQSLRLYDILLNEVQSGGEIMVRKGDDLVRVMLMDASHSVSPIYYSLSRNKREIGQQSLAVVQSLREMQSVFANIGHNNPPGPIEDEAMVQISALENELSELKARLENDEIEKAAENVVNLSKHVNTFLDNFMPLAGKGMAVLVVVSTATILSKAGIESGVVSSLLEKVLK